MKAFLKALFSTLWVLLMSLEVLVHLVFVGLVYASAQALIYFAMSQGGVFQFQSVSMPIDADMVKLIIAGSFLVHFFGYRIMFVFASFHYSPWRSFALRRHLTWRGALVTLLLSLSVTAVSVIFLRWNYGLSSLFTVFSLQVLVGFIYHWYCRQTKLC